jgi:hypothetical protein
VFAKIGRLVQPYAPKVFERIGSPESFLLNSRNFLNTRYRERYGELPRHEWENTPLYQDLTGAAVLKGDISLAIDYADRFVRTFSESAKNNDYFEERITGIRELITRAREDL